MGDRNYNISTKMFNYMYLNVYVIQSLGTKNLDQCRLLKKIAFLPPHVGNGQKNEITLSIYKIAKQQFTKYQKSMTIGKFEVKSHYFGFLFGWLFIKNRIQQNWTLLLSSQIHHLMIVLGMFGS
ncbi:hypothetical protein ACJX0J_017615 [Zea mays]